MLDWNESAPVNSPFSPSLPPPKDLLKQALLLPPAEKAELFDQLLLSLEKPDAEIDRLWANEAESRIDAYERGQVRDNDILIVAVANLRRQPDYWADRI